MCIFIKIDIVWMYLIWHVWCAIYNLKNVYILLLILVCDELFPYLTSFYILAMLKLCESIGNQMNTNESLIASQSIPIDADNQTKISFEKRNFALKIIFLLFCYHYFFSLRRKHFWNVMLTFVLISSWVWDWTINEERNLLENCMFSIPSRNWVFN